MQLSVGPFRSPPTSLGYVSRRSSAKPNRNYGLVRGLRPACAPTDESPGARTSGRGFPVSGVASGASRKRRSGCLLLPFPACTDRQARRSQARLRAGMPRNSSLSRKGRTGGQARQGSPHGRRKAPRCLPMCPRPSERWRPRQRPRLRLQGRLRRRASQGFPARETRATARQAPALRLLAPGRRFR
jgi:hypothetical protein